MMKSLLTLCLIAGSAPLLAGADEFERLREKHGWYLEWGRDGLDDYGWLRDTKCDGLLFNSLYVLAGAEVDIYLAEGQAGKWFRHAAQDCYRNGESASTISKDMFVGLFLFLWHKRDLTNIEELFRYGQAHNWQMGEGPIDRVVLSPGLITTLAEMRWQLGGPDDPMRHLPPSDWVPAKGFAAHLQVIYIHLWGLLRGRLLDKELDILAWQARREPRNALFQAAWQRYTGRDYRQAMTVLLDESLFPAARLPASSERCSFYLFQRDENIVAQILGRNPDWLPCPWQNRVHSGVDFLFASRLILSDDRVSGR